jgi:hypothetical protein
MENWDIRSLANEPHHPHELRSDDDTRRSPSARPAASSYKSTNVHERTYLLVADGEPEISQDRSSATDGTGFPTRFEPNERRTVRALSDARLVLVLAPWPGVGHPSRVAPALARG